MKLRDDGMVKVLDFGLAKEMPHDARGANLSELPTVTTGTLAVAVLAIVTSVEESPPRVVRTAIPLPTTQQVTAQIGLPLAMAPDGRRMMVVDVHTAGDFVAGDPLVLFEGSYDASDVVNYDVSSDGQRFVMIKIDPRGDGRRLELVLNWFQEVTDRAPLP